MFTFLFKKLKREQGPPLNETQRALVAKKFEILRQASFGFTQDRLLHIQEEDVKGWTDACTGELRRKIASTVCFSPVSSFGSLAGTRLFLTGFPRLISPRFPERCGAERRWTIA